MKKERYEHLTNEYSKIIGIYVNLDELCQSIENQIDLLDKQLQTFSFFDQHQKSTKDLSKESGEFLWFHLFNSVIARFPRNQQAKQQMVEMCKIYYRGNSKELKLIDQFEREYQSDQAIHWYSKQSFVYKLINQALRTEDIDLLYTFRFFITDLSESLAHEHEKILSSDEEILTVYRGVKLDQEEFDKLKDNQGKLISTNGYLSTSRVREQSLHFAIKPTKRIDVVSVLFHIECNVKLIDKSVIFADIAQFSEYSEEQEVLFDLNACFQIESIEQDGSLQLIRMSVSKEAETITTDYIELAQKETEKTSAVIVFGELMRNSGQYDKSQKYFEELLNDPNGEDIAWIEFNIGRALAHKGEWKEAREYYDRTYDRMMNAKPARMKDSAYVLNNIGGILFHQKKDDEALDYYQRALKIREKYYLSDDVDMASSFNNIGNIFSQKENYDEALEYYQRALKIRQKNYPSGHVDIASSLNNIGNILSDQRKYDEALDYHQRSLKMREEYYPSGHVDIATSLNNIGSILSDQRKYDEALSFYERALKMKEKYYPSGHVSIGHSLNNIGGVLKEQGKYDEALSFYERALEIKEKYYPSDHVSIGHSLSSIGNVLRKQRKYDEALSFYERALTIYQKYYSSDHVDTAGSLNNIGFIFCQQGKYDEALDCHQQSLKIREKYYPSGHVVIGDSLYNIGTCYKEQNKTQLALEFYQRALTIYERFLPVGHSDRVAVERTIHRLTVEK